MQDFNPNRRRPAVQVLLLLIATLGLLFGVVGCGDGDDEVVNITSTSPLPDGTVGQAYSFTFESENGGEFWVLQSGDMPPGLGLMPDGTLSGTPTTAGEFDITVAVFQEVINVFLNPADVWYDPVFGFVDPIDPFLYEDASVGLESDSALFTITIN